MSSGRTYQFKQREVGTSSTLLTWYKKLCRSRKDSNKFIISGKIIIRYKHKHISIRLSYKSPISHINHIWWLLLQINEENNKDLVGEESVRRQRNEYEGAAEWVWNPKVNNVYNIYVSHLFEFMV